MEAYIFILVIVTIVSIAFNIGFLLPRPKDPLDHFRLPSQIELSNYVQTVEDLQKKFHEQQLTIDSQKSTVDELVERNKILLQHIENQDETIKELTSRCVFLQREVDSLKAANQSLIQTVRKLTH